MSKKGASPTQLTLVVINLLFVAGGIAGMAAGGYVLIHREEVRTLTMIHVATNDLGLLHNAAILLITAGVVVFVLGFMGCRAAFRDQTCYRVVYMGLVLLCCTLTISACVLAFVYRDQLEDRLVSHLQGKLRTEYQGYQSSALDFSQAMDYAQADFSCCGVVSYTDFDQAERWTVRHSAKVPLTCCVLADREAYLEDRFVLLANTSCPQEPTTENAYIERPCGPELKKWIEEEATIVGAIALVVIILQVLSVLFLAAIMKNGDKDMDYLHRSNLYTS